MYPKNSTRMNHIRSRTTEIVNHDIIYNEPSTAAGRVFLLAAIFFFNFLQKLLTRLL